MTQHIAAKAAVGPSRAQALAEDMDRPQSNLTRSQALVRAGMTPGALNAFLVRFGFNNPDASYVKRQRRQNKEVDT